MPSTRDIKRRIKSIGNTRKVTRAMEMVAAAKMRRAIEAVLKTRAYANLSWQTVLNLSKTGSAELHPLLVKREEVKKIGVILITSNRGLCGGFNSAVIRKAQELVREKIGGGSPAKADFILLGKKGAAVYRYFGYNIAADFPKSDLIKEISEVVPVVKMVISDYLKSKYDKIFVAYTDFVSAVKQVPRVKQLLPFDIKAQEEFLGKANAENSDQKFEGAALEYLFEPSPREILNEMLPRLIEVQLFQALLESNAAEHSARMAAMHQATQAAGDLVDDLTLFYNKARQAGITREIAEISAGANALKD